MSQDTGRNVYELGLRPKCEVKAIVVLLVEFDSNVSKEEICACAQFDFNTAPGNPTLLAAEVNAPQEVSDETCLALLQMALQATHCPVTEYVTIMQREESAMNNPYAVMDGASLN